MIVLALDPGLAALGFSVIALGSAPAYDRLVALGTVVTEKSDKKLPVRSSDDLTRRGREVWRALQQVVRPHQIHAICVEAISYPRSSSAAAKTALSRGIVIALAETLGSVPIVEASPQEVKKAATGSRVATKRQVQVAVGRTFLNAERLWWAAGRPKAEREHAFDAAAVFLACRESEPIRMARSFVARSEIAPDDDL